MTKETLLNEPTDNLKLNNMKHLTPDEKLKYMAIGYAVTLVLIGLCLGLIIVFA